MRFRLRSYYSLRGGREGHASQVRQGKAKEKLEQNSFCVLLICVEQVGHGT